MCKRLILFSHAVWPKVQSSIVCNSRNKICQRSYDCDSADKLKIGTRKCHLFLISRRKRGKMIIADGFAVAAIGSYLRVIPPKCVETATMKDFVNVRGTAFVQRVLKCTRIIILTMSRYCAQNKNHQKKKGRRDRRRYRIA